MDRFITEINGRMPVALNDVRFMDNIYRGAFVAFLKTLGANNMILFGCQLSDNGNGTYSVSEGAAVINTELLLCSAHSFACTNVNEAYFVITETYDPEGLKRFGDNITHDTYLLRRVTVEQHAIQPINSISASATRFGFYTKTETDIQIGNAINALIEGAPGALDTLNELAAAMGDDPNFAATITNSLAAKVDKVAGYGLSKNDFTDLLLSKLNGIEANANNYVHPSTHPATMIATDRTHRFITDDQLAEVAYLLNSGAWVQPTAATDVDTSEFRYRMVTSKIVEMRGAVYMTGGTNDTYVNLFTLPPQARPVNGLPRLILLAYSGNNTVHRVEVAPTGVVRTIYQNYLGHVGFSHFFTIG